MYDAATEKWLTEKRLSRGDAPSSSEGMTKSQKLSWLKEEWVWLLETEEAAFEDACEVERNGGSKAEKGIHVRRWWALANAILWMFARTQAQHQHILEPFPSITLARLANISEDISDGNIPEFVADASKGGRGLKRAERHHIAYGIAYIEAVKRGEINDHAPNKTVRRAYNVTSQAVRGWMSRRDEICSGVPFKHLTPEQLTERMRERAKVYTKHGRGAPSEN